jgi:hypothetical protein
MGKNGPVKRCRSSYRFLARAMLAVTAATWRERQVIAAAVDKIRIPDLDGRILCFHTSLDGPARSGSP